MSKKSKSMLGILGSLGLGVALAVGIVAGTSKPADAWGVYIPPGGGNTEWCETCFGLYVCTTATVGGVCSITLGRCRTVNSCSSGGGGIWQP